MAAPTWVRNSGYRGIGPPSGFRHKIICRPIISCHARPAAARSLVVGLLGLTSGALPSAHPPTADDTQAFSTGVKSCCSTLRFTLHARPVPRHLSRTKKYGSTQRQ
jgi:hypothetical protein